jgi:tRNA threonylcarbamoyladenosine biosynthesis protein TsaB
MAAVDLLLRAAALERTQVEGIVATRGPGSFTGVRVALATAQGLAIALGVPAHGYSSLLAQAARTDEPECLAVQPARRGSVYAQHFSRRSDRPVPAGEAAILPLSELAAGRVPVVAPVGLALPAGTRVAAAHISTAEALLQLLACEAHADAATLAPLYLEPPPATLPAMQRTTCPPSPKAS